MITVEFLYNYTMSCNGVITKYKAGEKIILPGDDFRIKEFKAQDGLTVKLFHVEQSKKSKK